MSKEIDPKLAHIIKPGEQKPPPWDKTKCYRGYIPLDPARIFLWANGQDDPESAWGPTSLPGSYTFTKMMSVKAPVTFNEDQLPSTLVHHRDMSFVGIGFVVETIDKPSWWERATGKK